MGSATLRAIMMMRGLSLDSLAVRYQDGKNIIAARGRYDDGAPFDVESPPFGDDPGAAAARLADDLVAQHAGRKTAPDPLTAAIATGADRIASARVIAKAIVDGRKAQGGLMALSEKSANLAARVQAVPKALEARMDKALARLDAVEKGGGAGLDALEAHIADQEAAVTAAESAVRALSNGPLPSPSQSSSQG